MTTTSTSARIIIDSMRALENLDLDGLRAANHPECINREAVAEPPDCRQPGPDGAYAAAVWLHNLASDIHWEIHEIIAQDDLVALHCTMSGHQSNKHTRYDADGNPAQVMPNHGRAFSVKQTHWFRMRDNLIIEHWANRDDLGMATQLGWFGP